ncbi:MAG: dihydroorotase [Pseudomonadota bacterium]
MKTIWTNARLLDPASGTDAPGGVLVEGGIIIDAGPHLAETPSGADAVQDCDGRCLAPGLVDLRVKTGEPGEEHRETLASASEAAVAGGVTSMVVMPDTNPVIDDVALVEFVMRRGAATARNRVYAAGALTVGLQGEAIAEIGLMQEAGAVFFTNADAPVADPSVMKRALAYAAGRQAVVFAKPEDPALVGSGVMNSGALAARMGLSGMGRDAEWTAASRDLILAEGAGAKLVLDQASTARTVRLVEDAAARGVAAACTVAAHHLYFNELDVGDYLTYCKTSPPFRAEEDRLALVDGVARGAIQAVVSAHDPQPPEEKRLPFAEAAFGAAGLETTLSAMTSLVHNEQLTMLQALRPITCGPADLIGLKAGRLAKGAPADLIVFDPDAPWLCDREKLRSRSTNSPFDGRRLEGRVLKTVVGGEAVYSA